MENLNWLDKKEYSFKPNYLPLPAGQMHYLNEGSGDPIVMVHGTPAWSFLYRNLVKDLSGNYRCVVPDHLGFGLSGKPQNWTYTPAAHAHNLSTLIDHLQLKNITLIVHDFGGPIGLNYALEHPENINRLVIINTWMWSLAEEKQIVQASKLFGSAIGKILYRYFNFSAKFLLPKAFYNQEHLTPALHQQYLGPMSSPVARTGAWRLAQELTASGTWYESLWQRREALQNKPILLLWGTKDAFIPMSFLQKWQAGFPQAKTVLLESGHFVQEEKPEEVVEAIREFLNQKTKTDNPMDYPEYVESL